MSRGLKPGQKINRKPYKQELERLTQELTDYKAKIEALRHFVATMEKTYTDFGYQVVLNDLAWRFPVEEERR